MTRIVAGTAGGRQLQVPAGLGTRPTSDRVREALFNTLGSLLSFDGARVLDLYAGSGAVGLEALSRGAAHALLVDSSPRAVRTLRANVAALGLPGAEVRAAPVARVLASRPEAAYDLVFLDPPYADPVDEVLASLAGGGWAVDGGVVVVERSAHDAPLTWPNGIRAGAHRRYGDSALWYGRAS